MSFSAFVKLTDSRSGRPVFVAVDHIAVIDQCKGEAGQLVTRIKTSAPSSEWVAEEPDQVVALVDQMAGWSGTLEEGSES